MVLTLNGPARVSHSFCRDHLFTGQTGDSATLLLDRTVLLIGGFDGSGELMSTSAICFRQRPFQCPGGVRIASATGHMATYLWVSASL